jgi:hypothetical protein
MKLPITLTYKDKIYKRSGNQLNVHVGDIIFNKNTKDVIEITSETDMYQDEIYVHIGNFGYDVFTPYNQASATNHCTL